MKRKIILFFLISCLGPAIIFLWNCRKETEPESHVLSNLRILYVSNPDSTRAKDFVDLLNKHFAAVQTGDLKTFRETDSDDFDVTILDYNGDGFKAPRPRISPDFSRPVVTVGVIGAFICDSFGLKTGYL